MKKRIALILCIVFTLCTMLAGCKKEVAVDFSGLSHITTDGAAVTMTTEDYTATLTPDPYFVLLETLTVTVDGTVLTEGYTYDPETGMLTIAGDSVTGSVAVEAAAVETIVGSWAGTFDLTDALNEFFVMAGAGDLLQFEDFVIVMRADFHEDGTYAMYMDEAAGAEAWESLVAQMEQIMVDLIEEMLAQQGLDMTVDEFMEMNGMSMDQLLQASFGEDPLDEFMDSFAQSGNYVAEDGKLHTSLAETADPDMAYYETYTVADGCLTLDKGNIELDEGELNDLMAMLYPMVFERVTE